MSSLEVFPRRNLPPESEEWGREMEARVYALQDARSATREELSGQNRNAASTAGDLVAQLERIEDLYNSIPKIDRAQGEGQNFGLPSSGWNTIAKVSLPVPNGVTSVALTVMSSARLLSPTKTQNVQATGRLVVNGQPSVEMPGTWASGSGVWNNFVAPTFSWSFGAIGNTLLDCALQVKPHTAAAWPSGTGSYAVLSAIVIHSFT